jgi:quinoprotein glucose dehydrogenase
MSIILALCGAVLVVGGAWLAIEGGTWFHGLAGLALLACAVLLWRRQVAALHLFALLVLARSAGPWPKPGWTGGHWSRAAT